MELAQGADPRVEKGPVLVDSQLGSRIGLLNCAWHGIKLFILLEYMAINTSRSEQLNGQDFFNRRIK